MADVRLTATNPVDSSVVPVAANSRGELLVESPTVDSINNDVTINGDLTVTGTINGDTGGGVELPPNPAPGQVLGWENGQLAWVDQPGIPSDLQGLPTPLGPDGTAVVMQNGVPVWQYVTPQAPPPMMFSDYVTLEGSGASWDYSQGAARMFDGDTSNAAGCSNTTSIWFRPRTAFGLIDSFRVWTRTLYNQRVILDGAQEYLTVENGWQEISRFKGRTWGPNSELQFKGNGSAQNFNICALEFNGVVMVDQAVIRRDEVDGEVISQILEAQKAGSEDNSG